jgi:hypothetical protein
MPRDQRERERDYAMLKKRLAMRHDAPTCPKPGFTTFYIAILAAKTRGRWHKLSHAQKSETVSQLVQPSSQIPRLPHQLLILVLLHLQPPLPLDADGVETRPVDLDLPFLLCWVSAPPDSSNR